MGNPNVFTYLLGPHSPQARDLVHGIKVVANSDRGIDIGYINSFIFERELDIKNGKNEYHECEEIIRLASKEDLELYDKLEKSKVQIAEEIRELISHHELSMQLSHLAFPQFGKKLVIYYIAPERVDFRGLLKDLCSKFKMILELRQISPSDQMKALGGISRYGVEAVDNFT
jgi:cell fate regulator YaaT (PSP1 superfamily)